MASRLGSGRCSDEWIRCFAKIQRQCSVVLRVWKTRKCVSASRVDYSQKSKRTLSSKHTVAVHSVDIYVFRCSILWNVCHATIHRTNIGCVSFASRTESGHRLDRRAWHFSQRVTDGDDSCFRKKINYVDINGHNIHQLLCARWVVVVHQLNEKLINVNRSFDGMLWYDVGAYGLIFLPSGLNSFHHEESHFETTTDAIAYIPLISIYVMQFATSFATCTPNLLLSELFPFKWVIQRIIFVVRENCSEKKYWSIHRSRALATGIAASTNYFWAFLGTKLYYNFEMSMSLPGTVIFFGFIGVLG